MPLANGNRIAKKQKAPLPKPKFQQKNDESDSSDGFSDGDEEDQKDYRVGGYHPVEIGEVFSDRYKVLCKMGWGQYSTVWLVRDLANSKLFALKIQKSATAYMEAAQDELKLFTEVMKRVHQARECEPDLVVNIVELHDHFLYSGVNGTHMCFVYERLGGSLLDLIKHYNYKGIPPKIVRILSRDMLSGLAFLHHCGIIHTDLKPENVLLKAPLMEPPPLQDTMFDLLQQQIQNDPDVKELQKACEQEGVSSEERKRLKAKLKKVKLRIKKNISNNGIPTLWGFMKFNYKNVEVDTPGECVSENNGIVTPKSLGLTPSTWKYPDDCFYIKMYVTAPLKLVKKSLGPRHAFGDDDREDYSEWTFEFKGENDGAVNMFQLRGHGKDKSTRLHDIRHILMNDFEVQDRTEHLLWSLRFDGRRIRTVFSILENLIPGFRIIHLPNTKFSLSAYEHSLISNAGKEFLPPETMIFRNVNGVLVGLVIPKVKEGLEILPLEERLSMWPSDAMMNKALSDDRTIPPFFQSEDEIGCKVVDLGNSCFDSKKFTNDIQTRQYRCPETILHTPYSYPADIWSAACVIFELLTGDYLFQPREHDGVSRDLEQLALFEEMLGRIPFSFARTGKRCQNFFNVRGELKYQKKVTPHKIAYKLNKRGISLEESVLIEDLLLKMLCFNPSERLDAEACLRHPWFSYSPEESS